MDEIGDEVNDTSGNDKTVKEPQELTSESDEPNEFDDIIPETFSDIDEFDDIIPETFSDTDEFDDIIPETFSETDEFDDIIPETFSEPDEFDDILDNTIQEKEVGERTDEDQDSGDVGNVIENENIGSQSTSTVLTSEIEEIEERMEHQEQEEEIEIRPEEYQDDSEPIVNTDEIEFIKDVEELAEHAREIKAEDENVEPQAEKENAAYYAEQYYENLKEKEAITEQNSKEAQETEELRQEVAEELKGEQESNYKNDELEEEATIEGSKEITSTEEFEYLWGVRERLDREGKTPEEIEEVMHEAEEMYETLKNAEKLYEEQELEKLKLVDHEDEASEEDLKEELDRIDLVEQAVELEENLVQQGKSQEEIDTSVEEAIETTKFEESLEEIIESQELEKLKLVDHEDEATEEDLKEELDRIDLVEQAVELEENLFQQEELQEEIDARVEESIETTKLEENLEEIIEAQELEKLKLDDHEDEATEEDLKEDLDRIDLVEQAVELEEKLFQQGESQEEIDMSVEETIETTKFEESLEEIIESQELEKLKLVDHEDEATEEDLKEELDRIDLVEQAVELEENLFQQGELQEEIDARVEESIETTKLEENMGEIIELKQESIVNERLKKHDLEINKQNSNENVENEENLEVLKPELDAIESESVEEEDERLQALYRQETSRRPIYSRQKTKGYSQWLEQRELGAEKIKNSKSESEKNKKTDEESWKTTLKQWIREASEEECNAEFKSELKKALESYNEFEDLIRKFLELYEKAQCEKLSEKEKNRLKSLTERLQELGPIQLELLANIRAFKDYFYNHLWELMNRFFLNRVLSKFFNHISQKYKELRKEQKNEIIKYSLIIKQENDLHKRIFKYGESLHQGIVGIYYICEIFPKNREIDKKSFSGSELNYILDKHSQFFYTINKRLKDKDLIRYYGSITRKKKSNEKIYIITEKGIKFIEEIIEIKRRDFPILFDKLISTLEKRYIEYNKDLINSEKKIIIRSQEDINNKLRKIAGDNKIELVTSYRSDRLDINFRCKKCKKQFKDTYQLIKSRKDPKLFCPYCFPELKTNIYLLEELKIQISKFVFNELRKTTLHRLSNNKILDIIEYIKKLVFNFIEPQIIEKKSEFKEFIEKYICSIIGFLTEVKRLYETNQFINLSEISLLFHDKSIVSESMWQAVCRAIIKYLREEFDFNIRTKRYDSLPESTQQSIRNYLTLFKLILGVDGSGNSITYLDIDFKTEIKIYYDGKCQGIDGYCPFDIDYKFLPALSFDHRLENYNAIVKRKGMRYITPTKMLSGSFNGALTKMKSQIGGLDLRCRNCHSSRHHKMYNFLPIFNFLKSLHIREIDVNTTYVLDSVNLLAKKYFKHTKKTMKLSKKHTQAQILGRIRSQIFRLIKKKYIIEYIFGANYICPVCQKANINEHLTCFEAHHTNETIFENGLQKIILSLHYFKSTKWLIKKLITQECIYVCRNCHTMITTKNYNENALIILENEINALYVNNFYDNLNVKVNEKRDVIMHWKSELKNNMNSIPNPFLKMFDYGESIYSALICIYYICEIFSQDTKKDFFTAEELSYIQKKSSSYFKQYKNNLIDLEYIQIEKRLLQYRGFGFNKDIYKITFEGILKAKEIIEERLEEFPDEFNELVSQWEHRNKNYSARKQRLSAFDIVIICVYFVCKKEKIEFFLNAFHYIIDKENSYFGKHRKKLLNLEYITENQETANSFKEISITPKGIKRAEELISLITRDYFKKYQELISDWEKRYNEYLKTIENENKDPNYMHI